MRARLQPIAPSGRADAGFAAAAQICDDEVARSEAIGVHGMPLVRRDGRVRVLTHCNAGWLATVDWGTALAPIYQAHDNGIDVHVWVDETRPRNQGTLTAWELAQHGVPHTLIADNAGGHLMQHGEVDLCIVGTDRTTRRGDVCNKIGTYLKALAAHDNRVPFYAAVPSTSIDWTVADGRHPDRGAPRRRGARRPRRRRERAHHRRPGREPGVRRHAAPPDHRPHHRARRHAGGLARAVRGSDRAGPHRRRAMMIK